MQEKDRKWSIIKGKGVVKGRQQNQNKVSCGMIEQGRYNKKADPIKEVIEYENK